LAQSVEIAPGAHAPRRRRPAVVFAQSPVRRPQRLRQQPFDRRADEFLPCVSEQPLRLAVDGKYGSLPVGEQGRVEGALHQQFKSVVVTHRVTPRLQRPDAAAPRLAGAGSVRGVARIRSGKCEMWGLAATCSRDRAADETLVRADVTLFPFVDRRALSTLAPV